MVQSQEFEVTVGDILRIGDTTVTVIDIDGGEITFRIDDGDSLDDSCATQMSDGGSVPLPR